MSVSETTYTKARERFAQLLNQVTSDRQAVIIRRRGKEPVAMLPADELARLEETTYLLSSPENALRLLRALEDAASGRRMRPLTSIEDLAAKVGLELTDKELREIEKSG